MTGCEGCEAGSCCCHEWNAEEPKAEQYCDCDLFLQIHHRFEHQIGGSNHQKELGHDLENEYGDIPCFLHCGQLDANIIQREGIH